MATKNIVPRADGEGSLGTSAKKWGAIYADSIVLDDEETLAQKISAQNTRITTAEGNVTTLSGTVETLSGDVTTLYGNVDELSDGKLDKSGATLTGGVINRNVATDTITITGGNGNTTTPNGAKITLAGASRSSSAGMFWLTATNGTDKAELTGYPNGTLNWNGKGVERVNASGTNYVRYESGLQICWGGANISQATEFTYGASFKSGTMPFIATSSTANKLIYLSAISNTSVTFASATYSSYARYIAIGFWK